LILPDPLKCLAGDQVPCAAASTSAEGVYTDSTQANSTGSGRVPLRDLLAVAGGAAIVLVGLSGLVRPRLRVGVHPPTSFVLAAWAVGEALIALVCPLILALYADLVIVRLSLGWTLPWWELLDQITDEVSAVFSIVTGL
jgi:hypothetical protein